MKTINPHEIVRIFVNKSIVPYKKRGRGRPGYPLIAIVRLFVYAILIKCLTDKGLIRHLTKRPYVARTLGLSKIPHRTTVGRWRKKYAKLMEDVFIRITDLLVSLLPTEMLIADSSPIEDYREEVLNSVVHDCYKSSCFACYLFRQHAIVEKSFGVLVLE